MPAEILHANPDTSSLGRARVSFIESLRTSGRSVAVIEGCTGGMLSNAITNTGASRVISGAVAAYSREAKVAVGVDKRLIQKYGEFSLPVARAMAGLSQQRADLGIGVTGSLDTDGPVFVSYVLGGKNVYDDMFSLSSGDRRMKNHEATVRILSNATSLLAGKEPTFEAPYIGRPEGLFADEQAAVVGQAVQVAARAREKGWTIGTMESCTGLAIADNLTNVPHVGDVFRVGYLAYDENVKMRLGVPAETMLLRGVYSPEVAAKMAESVIARSGVDVAFATTGVLDVWDKRNFHSHVSPGTVSLAIAQKDRPTWVKMHQFDVQTRDAMKLAITNEMFDQFLQLTAQDTRSIRNVFALVR